MKEMKTCWIVAGPNGAGKSTLAKKYLPYNCADYVNADNIARERGLDGSTPNGFVAAGRVVHEKLNALIDGGRSFAIETTLSGRFYLGIIRRLRQKGWRVELHYIYIPSREFSAKRVEYRVLNGGHDVPENDIRRRYARSVANVREYSALCNYTACYDNSNALPRFVFIKHEGSDPWVVDSDIYNIVMNGGRLGTAADKETQDRMALGKFENAVIEELKQKSKDGQSVVIADSEKQPIVRPASEVLKEIPQKR